MKTLLNEYFKQNIFFYLCSRHIALDTAEAPFSSRMHYFFAPSPKTHCIIIIIAGCFHNSISFSDLILTFISVLVGSGFGRQLAQRHLVQKRCLPQPSGPDLTRAAAQPCSRDAVS